MRTAIIMALLFLCIFAQSLAPRTWVDDENDGTVDEHGRRIVPGEEPREVGLP